LWNTGGVKLGCPGVPAARSPARWGGLIGILAMLFVSTARSQHALTIVAPAAPGGGWDQTARALQRVFPSVEPDATVQVENVAGAAGTIGLARFVTAERGNPNALLITGLVMMSAITMNRAPVNLADTTPIARLTGEYEVIVVPAGSSVRTLRELVTAFRAGPETVTWGGGSAGGTDDLLVRLLAEALGVSPARVNYIAFPGGGAAVAALLGGQITAGVSGLGEFAGQIEAGTLRALAISAPERLDGVSVPTLRDEGVDLQLSNWRAVVAPPGLTDAERDGWTRRIERVTTSAAWRQVLQRNGWTDMLLTGDAFRQFLVAEQQRVDAVLQRLHANAAQEATRNAVAQNSDTQNVARATGAIPVTPMTAPVIVLSLLALVVIANVFTSRTMPRRERGEVRALFLISALTAHAIVLPVIGFVPASTALFVVTASLFGSRRWLRDLTVGAGASILLQALFTLGLGLTLPEDPVTRWFHS
jgi:putative tricarboxylic transport membrane protein